MQAPRAVAALVLALAIAACGSPPPATQSPTPAAGSPAACIGLEAAQCQRALDILLDRLAGVRPSYVAIAQRLCDGPCPGAERGVWLGHLTVEYVDGRHPETILIEVDGDSIDWEPIETVLVRVVPRSQSLAGPELDFTLGHCGLGSGVDVDGAFWDPVGMIDPDANDLVNSVGARFTLTSPLTATLRTERGAVLQLARHEGPKFLPGCD